MDPATDSKDLYFICDIFYAAYAGAIWPYICIELMILAKLW